MDARVSRPAARRRPAGGRDPARTRATILPPPTEEFTAKGLKGARVDAIARRSGANKRMIYHYFGNKEGLYLAVLESAYAAIRTAEIGLNVVERDPVDGMRDLIQFTWRYFIEHPEFLSLLATENLNRASYLKKSRRIRELHSPLLGMISTLLERGAAVARSAKRRSGSALYQHRGARLLLLLEPLHALNHFRPGFLCPRRARRAQPARPRCGARLFGALTEVPGSVSDPHCSIVRFACLR